MKNLLSALSLPIFMIDITLEGFAELSDLWGERTRTKNIYG
jgi:hypothetical protein